MYKLRYIILPDSTKHRDEFTYEIETKKKAHIEKKIEVVRPDGSVRLRVIKEY